MAQTKELLKAHIEIPAQELQNLGFKLNHKKCVWTPKREIEFLGFVINSTTMLILLQEEKIQKIKKECRQQEVCNSMTSGSSDRVALIDNSSHQCSSPSLSSSTETTAGNTSDNIRK